MPLYCFRLHLICTQNPSLITSFIVDKFRIPAGFSKHLCIFIVVSNDWPSLDKEASDLRFTNQ